MRWARGTGAFDSKLLHRQPTLPMQAWKYQALLWCLQLNQGWYGEAAWSYLNAVDLLL